MDDDFLARYQASYGNYRPPTPEEKDADEAKEAEAADAKGQTFPGHALTPLAKSG